MNSYELIMKDIKATISKYLECKMIVNPLFAEKKCNDFSISSNHNQTGIQKDAKFSEVYQNICGNDCEITIDTIVPRLLFCGVMY